LQSYDRLDLCQLHHVYQLHYWLYHGCKSNIGNIDARRNSRFLLYYNYAKLQCDKLISAFSFWLQLEIHAMENVQSVNFISCRSIKTDSHSLLTHAKRLCAISELHWEI
jgi:hypothetical protein